MTDTSGSQPMITPELVRLDVVPRRRQDRGDPRAGRAGRRGRPHVEPDGLAEDALAREATSPTGLPGGIAIPHCRTEAVDVPTLAFARLSPATDFGAKDGPADLAFLIAAPAGGDATHLKVLTQLARALVKKEFTDGLRSAASPQEVVDLVDGVVGSPRPPPPGAGRQAAPGHARRCRAGRCRRPASTPSEPAPAAAAAAAAWSR